MPLAAQRNPEIAKTSHVYGVFRTKVALVINGCQHWHVHCMLIFSHMAWSRAISDLLNITQGDCDVGQTEFSNPVFEHNLYLTLYVSCAGGV